MSAPKTPVGMWIDDCGNLIGRACWNYSNTSLVTVDPEADGSAITNGSYMFYGCSGLTSFTPTLSTLSTAEYMFAQCSAITEMNVGNLPNITSATGMFEGARLKKEVTYDLGKLLYGGSMFRSCRDIISFDANLSNLTNGDGMFEYCSQLTDFKSPLSSLSVGTRMFNGCKLNLESIRNIASSIRTHTDGATRNMPIGVDMLLVTQEQQDEVNNTMTAKGWTVQWQRR